MLDTTIKDPKELRSALLVEIAKIRRQANYLLAAAVGFWTLLVVVFWMVTGSIDSTSKLSTTAAYFVLFGWGSWFIYAYFLRMEAKQDFVIELLVRSFDMASESNKLLQDVKGQVQPIVDDVRGMTGEVKTVIKDVMEVAKKVHATVDRYSATGDMAKGFLEEAKATFTKNGAFGAIADNLKELCETFKGQAPPPGAGTFGTKPRF